MIYEIFLAIAINVYFSFVLSRQSSAFGGEGGGIRLGSFIK